MDQIQTLFAQVPQSRVWTEAERDSWIERMTQSLQDNILCTEEDVARRWEAAAISKPVLESDHEHAYIAADDLERAMRHGIVMWFRGGHSDIGWLAKVDLNHGTPVVCGKYLWVPIRKSNDKPLSFPERRK